MQDDTDIPVLTDLIEEDTDNEVDVTRPDLGLAFDHDLIIDEDGEPDLSFDPERLESAMESTAATRIGSHPELEQTIRRILDEHLELAWQEIRLAIEVTLSDQDEDT